MKNILGNLTIRKKLTMVFIWIAVLMFIVELMICMKVNESINEINEVYATNVDNNKLLDTLDQVQQYIYEYLNTRSTESLENFYRYEQDYQNLTANLNDKASEDQVAMMEKNIREMSSTYLKILDETILAKRGRNVEKYKTGYEEASKLYRYIVDYIGMSNDQHFRKNSSDYMQVVDDLQKMEFISIYVLLGWGCVCVCLIHTITGNIMGPLTRLAKTANDVSEGNFDVAIPDTKNNDEIGSVTRAFNSMMDSIREYIDQIQKNKEKEQRMLEQELLMETYVKDAQLKYLQAQINPHFLYNSLNAGVQLSMLEGAEETSVFLEKMADFFRYNVRKMKEDATLFEELDAVDNYIYIINVRFSGDIHFEKIIDSDVNNIAIPSMLLQPIVENSVNHGLADVDWERKICLRVKRQEERLVISIEDNGRGMTRDRIEKVLSGNSETSSQSDSTGVGLDNVKKRLELYYAEENLMQITSDGIDKGTTVTITILERGK